MPTVPLTGAAHWEITGGGSLWMYPRQAPQSVDPTYPRFAPTRKRSVERDILQIYRGMKKHQQLVGEYVRWYEFDTLRSTVDPVYDEGPSRVWLPSKQVPVLFVLFEQPTNVPTEAGQYPVAHVHFTVSFRALEIAGISNPTLSDQHFRDRIEWNGKLYNLEEYRLQGFVHGQYLTIGIDGREVKPEELQLDDPMPQ